LEDPVSRARLANPLALAVLTLLYERPMHPYEMSTTLRERRKEESIKLNYGSLYAIVAGLEKHGLVEVREVMREGNRPERTVYGITEAGKAKMIGWLSDLVSIPVKEFPQFEAALSLAGALAPDDVIRLLEHRLQTLIMQRASDDSIRATLPETFPRIFLIESEYARALLDAEITFVHDLVADLRADRVSGMVLWRRMHELRGTDLSPDEIDAVITKEFPDDLAWREEMTTG
jgi:DNA-binding PadR family transcriptional regulator